MRLLQSDDRAAFARRVRYGARAPARGWRVLAGVVVGPGYAARGAV
mgnify:CR=1 FL=1